MSDKVTLQSVAESFSRACGVPKKVSEQLARAFFDTVIDGLSSDESVKINGLGTFRVVEVASRESINVTNGERIVIAGYKKVNFIPEDGLLVSNLIGDMPDVREEVEAEVDDETETVCDTEDADSSSEIEEQELDVADEAEDDIEPENDAEVVDAVEAEINTVPVPEKVEVQEDDFSGIDMLICTPESVEEVRLELEQARADAERKLVAAKEAHREVLRLEALLEKLENGIVPESVDVEEEALAADVAEPVAEETEAGEPSTEESSLPMAAETVANDDVSISVELPEVQVTPESTGEAESIEEAEPTEESEPAEEPETIEQPETIVEPEELAEPESAEDTVSTTEAEPSTEAAAEESASSDALNRLLADKPTEKIPEKPKKKKDDTNYWVWVLIPLVAVLVIGIGIIGFKYHSDQEKQELKQLPVKPKNDATPAPQKVAPVQKTVADTIESKTSGEEQKANVNEAAPVAAKTVAEPAKSAISKTNSSVPKTYVLKKGESLTKVSQMFYNTKDSVRAIIRVNKFKDVDNVPYGTEINLP